MDVKATFSKATRNVDSCVLSGPSSSSWVVDCACMHASTSSRKGCCHWRPVLGGATPLQGREIKKATSDKSRVHKNRRLE